LQQIVDLQRHYQKFQDRNTEVLALAVQSVANARRMVQVSSAAFPVLADPDGTIAKTYQVYNRLGDNVAAPAVFIIDTSGAIVWSYVGKSANDRPNIQNILAHLPP
jgi:peroxiredoxin